MTKFTIVRTNTSLSSLAALESRLISLGVKIRGWDDTSIWVDVPVKVEMKVGMLLSDNCLIVKA